jgi:anti-sigma factor RsiW
MNDTDRDLVMALAQGNLSTTAAEEATARIEADPELAVEFAEQVVAVQFLQSAVPPMMSEAERSTLRTNLTTQLGLLPVASPGAVVPTKKSRWWAPALGMATAAVVVAAFVIFPGAQQESFQEVSMELEDTSASVSQAAESSPQTTAAAGAPAEQSEEIQSDSAAAPPLAGGDPVSVYDTDSVALDELLARADGADSPESIQRQMSGLSFKTSVDVDSDKVNACLNKLSTELPDEILEIFVIGADVEGDRTTVHVGFDSGQGVEGGLSLVLETCELVDSSPGG